MYDFETLNRIATVERELQLRRAERLARLGPPPTRGGGALMRMRRRLRGQHHRAGAPAAHEVAYTSPSPRRGEVTGRQILGRS